MSYFISEMYPSLQGEGPGCGMRSFFIRFHYCHLTCKWCDSKYTWHKKSGAFRNFNSKQIKEEIKNQTIPNIVLTGGEPCLYALEHLLIKNFSYQVETSGTIIPTRGLSVKLADGMLIERQAMPHRYVKQFEWIVSPKLKSAAQKLNSEALDYFSRLPNAWFKFVVIDVLSDLKQVHALVKNYRIDVNKVFISFEGIERDSQFQSQWVEKVLEHYHYSPRLQVLLWPKQRGK